MFFFVFLFAKKEPVHKCNLFGDRLNYTGHAVRFGFAKKQFISHLFGDRLNFTGHDVCFWFAKKNHIIRLIRPGISWTTQFKLPTAVLQTLSIHWGKRASAHTCNIHLRGADDCVYSHQGRGFPLRLTWSFLGLLGKQASHLDSEPGL